MMIKVWNCILVLHVITANKLYIVYYYRLYFTCISGSFRHFIIVFFSLQTSPLTAAKSCMMQGTYYLDATKSYLGIENSLSFVT